MKRPFFTFIGRRYHINEWKQTAKLEKRFYRSLIGFRAEAHKRNKGRLWFTLELNLGQLSFVFASHAGVGRHFCLAVGWKEKFSLWFQLMRRRFTGAPVFVSIGIGRRYWSYPLKQGTVIVQFEQRCQKRPLTFRRAWAQIDLNSWMVKILRGTRLLIAVSEFDVADAVHTYN